MRTIANKSKSPDNKKNQSATNLEKLQTLQFKQWFFTRCKQKAQQHYQLTAGQIKTYSQIDEMFLKLDEDGSNTLSMSEITALFDENGIKMTIEQVAKMFSAAQKMHLKKQFLKQRQNGGSSKVQEFMFEKKPLEVSLKQMLNPDQFKIVASSPPSLKGKLSSL